MKKIISLLVVSIAAFIGYQCLRPRHLAADKLLLSIFKNDFTGVVVVKTFEQGGSTLGDSTYAWKLRLRADRLPALSTRGKADPHDLAMAQDWVVSLGESIDKQDYALAIRDYIDGYSVYYLLGSGNEVYVLAMRT